MKAWPENLPKVATIISGSCFILFLALGLLVDRFFYAFAVLSVVMPDLLREFGWLTDMDEFQLEASKKASHHAYISTAVFSAIIIGNSGMWMSNPVSSGEIFTLLFVLLVVVKYSSYFIQFWDKKKASFRILLFFAIFWSAFVLLGKHQYIRTILIALLAVPVPFFVLALLSIRFPVFTGIVSTAASILTVPFYLIYFYPRGLKSFVGLFGSFLLLSLPLAAAGISLLTYSMKNRREVSGGKENEKV